MTVGQTIYDLIQSMMMGADISSASPGHINKVYPMEGDPGLVGQIDSELSKTAGGTKQEGKPKSDEQMEKNFRAFWDRIEGETEKKKSGLGLKKMLQADLGIGRGYNAFNLLANPKGAMLGILKTAGPLLASIVLAYEIAPRVAKLLTKRGSVWDLTFRETIDTLSNQLRTRESQKAISVGLGTQVIFTSRAGTITPRDSYNTYQQKNENQANFEREWQVRNTTGADSTL